MGARRTLRLRAECVEFRRVRGRDAFGLSAHLLHFKLEGRLPLGRGGGCSDVHLLERAQLELESTVAFREPVGLLTDRSDARVRLGARRMLCCLRGCGDGRIPLDRQFGAEALECGLPLLRRRAHGRIDGHLLRLRRTHELCIALLLLEERGELPPRLLCVELGGSEALPEIDDLLHGAYLDLADFFLHILLLLPFLILLPERLPTAEVLCLCQVACSSDAVK